MENKVSFRSLKSRARGSLKGKWGLAIAVTILNGILLILPSVLKEGYRIFRIIDKLREGSFTSQSDAETLRSLGELISISFWGTIFVWVFSLVIIGALAYGVSSFFLNLIRDNNARIENLFEGFKLLGKTILINVVSSIFKFLWSLLGIIIIMATIVPSLLVTEGIQSEGTLGFVRVLIVILAVVMSFGLQIFLNRYSLIYYIASDNREMEIMDIINKSVKLMKGKKIRLWLLNLSFIGWYILCILSFGIGLLWVIPYVNTTFAAFYDSLVEQENVESVLEVA